ncbi:uncharacterized protein [Lolium perenne]|uniref:uncharacterized protein n=1 Tax=Lolium perenne TaxID=4522 RepID=UPI003A997589
MVTESSMSGSFPKIIWVGASGIFGRNFWSFPKIIWVGARDKKSYAENIRVGARAQVSVKTLGVKTSPPFLSPSVRPHAGAASSRTTSPATPPFSSTTPPSLLPQTRAASCLRETQAERLLIRRPRPPPDAGPRRPPPPSRGNERPSTGWRCTSLGRPCRQSNTTSTSAEDEDGWISFTASASSLLATKMKRRSPNSCPGTSKDRPRAGAAAAGRLDSDKGAQGDAVLDMADLEEELSQIDPYTTMPAHTPKGHHLRVPRGLKRSWLAGRRMCPSSI